MARLSRNQNHGGGRVTADRQIYADFVEEKIYAAHGDCHGLHCGGSPDGTENLSASASPRENHPLETKNRMICRKSPSHAGPWRRA